MMNHVSHSLSREQWINVLQNGNEKKNYRIYTNKQKTGISQKLFYKRSLIIDCRT